MCQTSVETIVLTSGVAPPTGAERVVSLKMEIPGSLPPLIEEMLEEHQEKSESEERKGRQHSVHDTHAHTASPRSAWTLPTSHSEAAKRKKKELWGVVVHFTTSSATDAATKCLTSVSPSGGRGVGKLSPQPVDGVIARRVKSPSLTSGETKEKCRSDVLVRHIFKSLLYHCIYMCMRFHSDYFLPHPLTNYFSI